MNDRLVAVDRARTLVAAATLLAACTRAPDAPDATVPPAQATAPAQAPALAAAAANTGATTLAHPWFEDVAHASGIDFRHVRALQQRFWFPECIGSGLGWLDYDGDGHLDLFVVQAGDLAPGDARVPGDRLYRNRGDGTFEDATERAGIVESAYGMGCTVGDYDGDGDPDLYVTNYGADVLWRNDGGHFTDVTRAAGLGDTGWGTSCGFFDADADGDLDLFVVRYVRWTPETETECKSTWGERDYCAPNNYNRPAQPLFYRNEGDGRFTDASQAAGFGTVFGNGLGLALADFDRDGWLDVYVSNDGMPNQLWINQKNGRFVDKALLAGAAVNRNGAAEASMGTVPVDVDSDGWIDLFITNLRGETNTLYLNKQGVFADRTPLTGLAHASLQFTGFGDGFADFDLDGELDLYVVNGRVGAWRPVFSADDPYAEPTQVFRGTGKLRYEELAHGGAPEALIGNGRGAAFADYDDDGDVDVAILNNHGPLRLLRNVAERRGHWLVLRVLDAHGSDVPGTALELDAGGRRFTRTVAACSSFCSSADPRVHVGLGSATQVELVRVTWPGGTREEFGPFAADRMWTVQRGAGRAAAR